MTVGVNAGIPQPWETWEGECRSQTCRLELSERASSPEAQKALPILLNRLGAHLPRASVEPVDPDDPDATMVIYLSG